VRGTGGLLIAVAGAYGVFLLYTAVAFGWRGAGLGPSITRYGHRQDRMRTWLAQAGLGDVAPANLAALSGTVFVVAGVLAWGIFGGVLPPLIAGLFAASFPLAGARARQARGRAEAREAWPRMIEEIRLQAVTLGRSIPQALLQVGMQGPEEMRSAFLAAQREWMISTDFDRTLNVLKAQLADPTADAVCETLLIAHEIGGSDVDQRLRALHEDRTEDLQARKDARSKQAGVRFARYFVLIVPFGMALVGLTIGEGRAAYGTAIGQVMVLVAFGLMAVCWLWAAQLLKLPEEERVFYEDDLGASA
jgi:tight adherence protein B